MHENLSDTVRRDPSEPTIVRIDPMLEGDGDEVVLQYTYLVLSKGTKLVINELAPEFKNWVTADIVNMMADDEWGFRFLIGSEKTNAGPLILRQRMIFSPVLFMMIENDEPKPMHCKKCAEAYVSWFDYMQTEWAEAYHGIWYQEYCKGKSQARHH